MMYNVNKINEEIKANPEEFVRVAEEKYENQIASCVNDMMSRGNKFKFILLAGPSSAGKTTTSHLLKENLAKKGYYAKVVSIDNFFLERSETPKLPNGKNDYESLRSLDWNLFGTKMNELIENKKSILPVFDFVVGKKYYPEFYTTLNDNEIIIIEGLHALNSIIDNYIPTNLAYKIYINSESEFCDDNGVILSKETIKLVRRILRDSKKRGISPDQTFDSWPDVIYGEATYINPNIKNAYYKIDTTHSFEPSVYYSHLKDAQIDCKTDKINDLLKILSLFEPIETEMIPMSSLTQEFLGGNDN